MRVRRRRRSPSSKRTSRRTRKSLLLVFALIFAPAAARQARAACVEFAGLPAITIGADSARDVSAADLDGDGDLDVLSASYLDGEIAWLANDGAGGGWTKTTISTAAAQGYAVVAGDLDGDGDLDVVSAAKAGNRLTWYANDGAGGGWASQAVSTLTATFHTVALVDAEGDGDLDVVSGEGGAVILWHENDGLAGATWTVHAVRTTANTIRKIVAGDVDGDGDADLLSASDNFDEIAWYENDGTGGGWALLTISSSADSARGVAAADLDGDGDLDALSASFGDATIAWYQNSSLSGDGSTWVASDVATAITGVYSVHSADVDGDGDLDVLSASSAGPEVAWFENAGTGSGWTRHTISLATVGAHSVFAGDIDGDGDTDALSASINDDKIAWYRNDRLHGQALFAALSTISAAALDATSVFAADFDRDGHLDVLSSSFLGDSIDWYRNVAEDGTVWSAQAISTVADGAYSAIAADVDGDGSSDVVAGIYADGVFWYANVNDDGSVWSTVAIFSAAVGTHGVWAADLDGDGDTDVLSAQAANGRVAWHENLATNGNGTTWTMHDLSNSAVYAIAVFAGDVDGDGNLDALSVSANDDTIAWFQSDDTPLVGAWTEHAISTSAGDVRSLFAADLDGDGHLDVVTAAGTEQTVTWYENDDTPLDGGWAAHVIATGLGGARAVWVADVDGDGDPDVVAGSNGAQQRVGWFENDGTPAVGAWTAHVLSTTTNSAFGVFAGDVDGDGDLDVLSAGNGDDTIAWFPNLGTKVHDDGFDSDGATTACWSTSVPPVP